MAEKHKETQSLEKVTDYVEEKEIDSEKTAQAMSLFTVKSTTEVLQQDARGVAQEHVDLILDQLDLSRDAAIASLKKNNGDLTAALRDLIRS